MRVRVPHRGWAAPTSHGLPMAAASRASSSRAPTPHCEGGPSGPSTRSPVHRRRVSSWAISKGRGTRRVEMRRGCSRDAAERYGGCLGRCTGRPQTQLGFFSIVSHRDEASDSNGVAYIKGKAGKVMGRAGEGKPEAGGEREAGVGGEREAGDGRKGMGRESDCGLLGRHVDGTHAPR